MRKESQGFPHKIVCFYFEKPVDLQAAFQVGLDCFSLVSLKPTTLGSSIDGKKVKMFERSRLHKQGFGHIPGFELYAIPDYLDPLDPWRGFLAMFSVSNGNPYYKPGYKHATYAESGVALSVRAKLLPDPVFDEMCLRIARLVRPGYGFRNVFPACGIGLPVTGLPPTGVEFHGDGDQYYQAGFVETLTSWNVLNQYHLCRRIENLTLAEWIGADSNRGSTEPYVEGCWLWKVPKHQIRDIQKVLEAADIFFDPHKHFYPWTWPFAARMYRGDLGRPDVLRLVTLQTQETGRFPKPPFLDPVTRLPNEQQLTEILKKCGFAEEAAMPLPAPTVPATLEPRRGPGMGIQEQREYFRTHLPRCLAGFTARPTELPGLRFAGHGEDMNVVFGLQCACGHAKFVVLGESDGEKIQTLTAPLALRCDRCSKVTELFDPQVHGHDAELTGQASGSAPQERAATFACEPCGPMAMEVYARFEYPDDLFDGATPGREQDFFTWFTVIGKCAGCEQLLQIYDDECA